MRDSLDVIQDFAIALYKLRIIHEDTLQEMENVAWERLSEMKRMDDWKWKV
jgi:hypothetical protein